MKTLALRTATALILVGLAAAAPKAQAALLPVVDPGFEFGGNGGRDVDTENSERGWFEAVGGPYFAEFEQSETNSIAPTDEGSGETWGALGTDGWGRLYQNIGTVDLVTYTVAGNMGRQSNYDFTQIHVELWATSTSFTGADETDLAGTGTLLDSATLSETSLFGNTNNAAAAAPFSVDLAVSGSAGDDLWVAFAGTVSAGDAVSTGARNEVQLIDDISVVIPEPSSLVLLLLGSVAAYGRRRPRR